MNREDIATKVADVPFWWHSITLGHGITTPGNKTAQLLELELNRMHLPDLNGKSVLDIGAWDGFFSFECEKRGARRVVALDHYVWCLDIAPVVKYWKDCKEKGIVPEQYDQVPGMWRPDELPGKKGFDAAHEILQSRVESIVHDFMTVDLTRLGSFNVVLFLGVLYHLQSPFDALKRLAQVTKELAIIETEAVVIPGFEDHALFEFYESNELNDDVNNWWAPNQKGLVGTCRAAGFKKVEMQVIPPQTPQQPHPLAPTPSSKRPETAPPKSGPIHYRAVVHAWK